MRVTGKRKMRLFVYLSIITVSFGVSFVVFLTVIRPIFLQRLEYYGQKTATEAINNAVSATFSENDNFSELVYLDKNSDGSVSALKTNTFEMNKLRMKISDKIIEELDKIDTQYIKIPIGSMMGNELLAGMGPDIKLKIRPLGLLEVEFYDNFEDCGINQSRHTIYIVASVDISVVTQQFTTKNRISAKIPVAETVIVGNVPKYLGTSSSLKATFDE